jgi:hypothetical protein
MRERQKRPLQPISFAAFFNKILNGHTFGQSFRTPADLLDVGENSFHSRGALARLTGSLIVSLARNRFILDSYVPRELV